MGSPGDPSTAGAEAGQVSICWPSRQAPYGLPATGSCLAPLAPALTQGLCVAQRGGMPPNAEPLAGVKYLVHRGCGSLVDTLLRGETVGAPAQLKYRVK